MKKLILLCALASSTVTSAQSYFSLGTDVLGDDYSFSLDAMELSYGVSSNQDSLFVKIMHGNARPKDFGFGLAIDTNLNTTDGSPVTQNNIYNNSPNTSMNYDILLYAAQNGFFPGIFTEAYEGSSGNIINLNFELDTVDPHYSVFRIALADIGGDLDLNLIGFCGSFDITSTGPTDAVPNNSYGEVRTATIGLADQDAQSAFSVYPNPARDVVQVKGLKDGDLIIIRDLSGRAITEEVIQNGMIKLSFPLSGIYLLENPQNSGVVKIQFKP